MTTRLPVVRSFDLREYGLNPQRPPAIDSSMLKDFMDCPSMFYLRHVLGLRRKSRSAQDIAKFDWGTAWHGTQEQYWKSGMDLTVALTWLDQHFPAAIRADSDKHGRSKERMFQMFLEYVERFSQELNDDFELMRTEQFFDILHEKTGIRWSGRLDKIRARRRNGKIVIWDYKTTSAMSDLYFEGHEHGFQLPGYVWAAGQLFTESVEEVVLDVLYTLKTKHEFYRRTFRYTRAKLEEWTRNINNILDQINHLIDKHLENPDAWVKNWQECTRYGRCNFTDVHFMDPGGDARLRLLSDEYVEDRWDPLNHADEAVA